MPVTKLSREFYERFGDKVADELVGCLNTIEAGYRAEIRDLFETHFARFEEKLERRLAETKADMIKWTFVFWAPVALAAIGLYFR